MSLDANEILLTKGPDGLRSIHDAGKPYKPVTRFKRTNTNEIMATKFDPIKWIIPGYVSDGFSILAGRQKLGKTWLAIDWAVSVATGGIATGSIPCGDGDVLYIDMENGHRRIQRRIETIFPNEHDRPDMARLEWLTDAPQLDSGLLDQLDDWRAAHRNPRFVVIDVLQGIKPTGIATRNSYENDYTIWAPLQRWATLHSIAVLGLHHTRKGGADDPLEALSGSNGLSACADSTLVLDQDQNGRTLYVRGRDIEEKETALLFAGGSFTILGEAADVRRTDERAALLTVLLTADEPMNPKELAIAMNSNRNSTDQLLYRMAKAGEVEKAGRGLYIHPERQELRNIDKKVRSAPDVGDEDE